MGSGASNSRKSSGATGSTSQIKGDQINENKPPRPSSSPAAISANDTDSISSVKTSKRTRRPTSSSSKVQPLLVDGSDNLSESTQLKEAVAAAERKAADYERQIASVQASVSKLESEKASLIEQVNTFQSQLDNVRDSTAAAAADGDRKDAGVLPSQQIAALQQELAEAKTRIKKISAQYKRKMRQFNVQLAECKQENALEYFEQKLLVDQLKDENSKLLDQLHTLKDENAAGKTSTAAAASNESFPASDSRLALVLDLSSKVSEQEAEIARLKSQLKGHGKADCAAAAAATDNPFNGGLERQTSWMERCLLSSRGEKSTRSSNISNGSVDGHFESDHSREWQAGEIANDCDVRTAGDGNNAGQYHNGATYKEDSFGNGDGKFGSVVNGNGGELSDAGIVKTENLRKISAPHDKKRNGRKLKLAEASLNNELETRDSSHGLKEKQLTITLSPKDVSHSSKETKQTNLLSSSKEQMHGSKPPSGSSSRKFSNNSRAN